MKPISPNEVVALKKTLIPDVVTEAFNELIAKNWNGYTSVVKQSDAIALILNRSELVRQTLFDNKYLDIEDIYRAEGWKVEYDKPAYCETYEATFTFSK